MNSLQATLMGLEYVEDFFQEGIDYPTDPEENLYFEDESFPDETLEEDDFNFIIEIFPEVRHGDCICPKCFKPLTFKFWADDILDMFAAKRRVIQHHDCLPVEILQPTRPQIATPALSSIPFVDDEHVIQAIDYYQQMGQRKLIAGWYPWNP